MFCPKCRSEYIEGFLKCSDCMVPLVESLPPEEPEPPPEYVDLQEVMTSLDSGEIAIVRSILDDHNIPYVVEGETFIPSYGMPARFLVPKNKVIKAMKLLKNFVKA